MTGYTETARTSRLKGFPMMSDVNEEIHPLSATHARIEGKTVSVYTDGGVVLKNPSTVGGTWAFVVMDGNDKVTEDSGFFPAGTWGLETISNNVTELAAVMMALRVLPDGQLFTLYTDSLITLRRVVDLEEAKWKGIPDKLRALTIRHAKRAGGYSAILLAGHPTKQDLAQGYKVKPSKDEAKPFGKSYPVSVHNVRCDELCTQEAKRAIEVLMEEEAARVTEQSERDLEQLSAALNEPDEESARVMQYEEGLK